MVEGMTNTESQQEQAKHEAGERLYFRPCAERAPFGVVIREGFVIVTEVVDHGSATLHAPRFSYVVRALDGGGTQGTDDRELYEPEPDPGRCPGCGLGFAGARGLRAHQSKRFISAACRRPGAAPAPDPKADMSATIERMTTPKMTKTERAKAANAALTTEQRSAAGRARAAQLHSPAGLARRLAAKWPELSDEDRKAIRRELRAAGVIT